MKFFIDKSFNNSFDKIIAIDPLISDDGKLNKVDYDKYVEYCNSEHLIECDELMIPIIMKLNKKGYVTKYCCSGHISPVCCGSNNVGLANDSCYIVFDETVELDSIPEGFNVKPVNNGLCVYRNIDDMSLDIREELRICNRFDEILYAINKLRHWSTELPSLRD